MNVWDINRTWLKRATAQELIEALESFAIKANSLSSDSLDCDSDRRLSSLGDLICNEVHSRLGRENADQNWRLISAVMLAAQTNAIGLKSNEGVLIDAIEAKENPEHAIVS